MAYLREIQVSHVYPWNRLVKIHKWATNNVTNLSFNDFIEHYYSYNDVTQRYIQIKTLGDE